MHILSLALVASLLGARPAAAERPVVPPDALLALARQRLAEAEAAPVWFKRLRDKRLTEYARASENADFRSELLADAIRVFRYFETEDTTGQFDSFVRDELTPFVASLDFSEIKNRPVARWTVESLVIHRMVKALGALRDFPRRAFGLIRGKHLKGASSVAAVIVGWGVAYHFFPQSTWSSTLFLGGFAGLALTGPFNAVTTAAAGFFVRPTTELVKTLGARITGDLEAKINRGYDWLVARLPATGDVEHNDTMKIATFDEEHTDFARMSPEDQLKNWARGLNIFIMVENIFKRLLRDTHHGGRDLMMLSWTDSQNISQLVETLNVEEQVLRGNESDVLAPYRHAMIARGDFSARDEFDRRTRRFRRLTEAVWLNPDQGQDELDQLAGQLQDVAEGLRGYGLSDPELRELLDIQRRRGRTIGKLITAVSIGHLRQFYGAERNRNLARDAHAIAHAIQVGLGTEEYTERYLPLVRRQMRLMGMEYSDEDPESPVVSPLIIARERCLIKALRAELKLPARAKPETYACINALIGYDEHRNLSADPSSATARFMAALQSQGHRLEAGGIIKFARVTLADDVALQAKVAKALARCR